MQYKILLIDDDQDDRDLFIDAATLISDEIEITTLESGVSLVTDLNNEVVKIPDLIFLDINIPEMDGWTCLSLLKENEKYAFIPVIMYSTSHHKEDIKRAKEAGALTYLSKPYDFKELTKALEEITAHLINGTIKELTFDSKSFFE